jgi:hypothetical protein
MGNAMTTPSASHAEITARDITAALRRLYPGAPIRTWAHDDGTATVRMPPPVARYLGVGRDAHAVAAWISCYAPYGVRVTGHDWTPQAVMVTLARTEHGKPADPRGSTGVPSYRSVDQVAGTFPVSRMVQNLIKLAIDAGCRPHLAPERSPHGRRYRVQLWHVNRELLHGCIDVFEESGKFAEAWLQWGRGHERKTADPAEVRAAITSARDLHRVEAAARRPRRGSGIGNTSAHLTSLESAAAAACEGAQLPGGGPVPSRQRAGNTAGGARQARPRSPR